jgi:hypothetical protein
MPRKTAACEVRGNPGEDLEELESIAIVEVDVLVFVPAAGDLPDRARMLQAKWASHALCGWRSVRQVADAIETKLCRTKLAKRRRHGKL